MGQSLARPRDWRTRSAAETEACGAAFAWARPPLDRGAAIVHLGGDLGSGKTTWVRGFLRALGITQHIKSPTYTLLERYEPASLVVVHLDLYRLHGPEELEPLGLRELYAPHHLWLIEWPDRGAGHLPDPDLRLQLAAGALLHSIQAAAFTSLGADWLGGLAGRD
ncbi:MAG TPA: tRNA (adenosine(37)-N6)-threonylcarbamoyltransferase complex ATPase subunit type 1 TsaE [Steroidobacteraceae bacterium]